MRALYPGSFDPVTNGHLNLIERAVSLADSVVVAVSVNIGKRPLFTDEERIELLREVCRRWPSVEVRGFHGLVVEAARHFRADVIIRGVRNSSDFDHEMQMAHMNRSLSGIETLLLPAVPELAFVSTSLLKEIARFGGDVTPYVPGPVAAALQTRLQRAQQP